MSFWGPECSQSWGLKDHSVLNITRPGPATATPETNPLPQARRMDPEATQAHSEPTASQPPLRQALQRRSAASTDSLAPGLSLCLQEAAGHSSGLGQAGNPSAAGGTPGPHD